MDQRVIVFDLDGTLLNEHKQILPESIAALTQARQQGFTLLLATGRHHITLHPFYQALQLTTPIICCNGTYLYDYQQQQVISANPLDKQVAQQLVNHLQQIPQLTYWLYADDVLIYQQTSDYISRTMQWSNALPASQRAHFQQAADLLDSIQQANAIWKIATSMQDMPALLAITEQLARSYPIECEQSWHDQIDIVQAGNSKGNRLQQWLTQQGIDPQQVIAFGDNTNDISMLKLVGLPIVMGNAKEEVKQYGRYVIGDNNQPSIAQFLYQHLL